MTLQDTTQVSFVAENFSNITSLIEVILVGLYVLFTVKTFRQIKKQTDLQLKAYLSTDQCLVDEKELTGNCVDCQVLNREFSNDWKTSMERHFPDLKGTGVFNSSYYCLVLTNYGNTEIKDVDLIIQIGITNSQESITNKKLTKGEVKEIKVRIKTILNKGVTIKYPLFSTASYPIYDIITYGVYKDVRNQVYNIEKLYFAGENNYIK